MNNNWKRMSIDEVILDLFDGPHATPKPANEGPVFLGIKNITDDGMIDLTDVRHISLEDYPKWTKRVTPQKGDIVFTYEATLNRYAIIPEDLICCLGRRVALIRPNTSVIYTKFLFYYFFSRDWRETIEKNLLMGSTVDRIPLSNFKDFKISVPSYPVQKRIADILGNIDAKIQVNKKINETLEEIGQLYYKNLFVNFELTQNLTLKESEIGSIPLNWSIAALKDIFQFKKGKKPKELKSDNCSSNLPYLNIEALNNGYAQQFAEGEKLVIAEDSDVLMVMDGNSSGSIYSSYKGVVGSTLSLLEIKNSSISPHLLYYILKNHEDSIRSNLTGSAIPHADKGYVYSIQIAIPDENSLNEINSVFKNIRTQIQKNIQENVHLLSLKEYLLPRLFSGEIQLKDLTEVDTQINEFVEY
ncbi:restriction endonuclease subunit S [Robertmurraya sp. GLU-23]